MGGWNHLPDDDWDNDGWTCNGTGDQHLWQCWDDDDDSHFAQCPPHKGKGVIRFPVDITAIPAGAVVTSVTLMVRTSTGTGTPVPGQAPSLTIALSCDDDTSREYSRTCYPTSTISTIEIATFKKDAKSINWDIERINHVLVSAYGYDGIFDLIRVHKLYAVINYRYAPTITITAPTGTVLTPSPVISWTYRQQDGDPEDHSEYKVFTAAQTVPASFNVDTTSPAYKGTIAGAISSFTLPTSLNPDNYWVYVRSYSSFGAKSVWTGRQFTVAGPSPGVPGVPDPLGVQPPGVGVVATVTDSVNGSAILTIQDTSNMLSVQDADAETLLDGTTLTTTNCTLARDSTQAFPGGVGSWQVKSTGTFNMNVFSDWIEVAPGQPITGSAQFIAAASARSCAVNINFFDANFTDIGGALPGVPVADATGTWTSISVVGTTPNLSNLALARVTWVVQGPGAANEIHNLDRLGLMYGNNVPWSDGGHMSRNLLSSWYSTLEGGAQPGEAWTPNTGSSLSITSPSGIGTSGTACAQLTYNGVATSLAFRAAGSIFTSPTTGADYTLNKPAGTANGDLMLAFVQSAEAGSILAPAGWTLVDSAQVEDGATDGSLYILKRTAGASEPSSWTDGTLGTASAERSAVVVAYSGAANASQQFIGEATGATGNNNPTFLSTPTVNNTDPNAWRVSAFGFTDDSSGGSQTANSQAPSLIPGIAFVGTATAWTSTASDSGFTVNRPSGVRSGDLMVATIAVAGHVSSVTLTGWTLRDTEFTNSGDLTYHVFSRFAGGSEPGSWGGTISASYPYSHSRVTECSAYRNVNPTTPFINATGGAGGSGSSFSTGTISNNNSRAWLITAFSANTDGNYHGWSAPMTRRSDDARGIPNSNDGIEIGCFDSNGPVGTGNHSIRGTYGSDFFGVGGYIGLLNPLSSAPSPPGNETSRAQGNIGTSSIMYLGVYDSAGPVALGNQSITGNFTPGDSDGAISSAAGWVGLIKPAATITAGLASATMATAVSISAADSSLLTRAANTATLTASFIGTAAGTPLLTVNFYRANQLLGSSTAPGASFGTTTWSKSAATFAVPTGTTRLSATLGAPDRNVSDGVFFDRVSLALGDEVVYRPGTTRAAHPIWAVPQLEYADDDGTGYGPWNILAGSATALPPEFDAFSGYATYVDHTVVPLRNRKYRAKTVSYGLAGDTFISAYGPDSAEFSFIAQFWWLKDIANPLNNLQLKVKYDTVSVDTTNTAVAFQPLGRSLPIVLSEGFKGDQFTITFIPMNHNDWVQLKSMCDSGRTLFLQSDADQSWWVRATSNVSSDMLPTFNRQQTPIRQVKVTFLQVDPEV